MYKYIILIILYFPIFSWLYYLNKVAWILEFILGMIMYLTVFYLFHIVWKHYRKKEELDLIEYGKKFYLSVGTLIYVTVWIIWLFWYYHLEYKPLNISQVTISNWEKNVVFQKMIHIAKPHYYESIQQEIKNYKQDGYVYFFEWVQWWSEENMEKFNKALWIEFDTNLYSNLSKLYDLVPQKNWDFLNIENNEDYNIDMNIDEIIQEYEQAKKQANITNQYSTPVDVNWEIINQLTQLNPRQLVILQFVNLSFLSALTKNEEVLSAIQNNFWNEILFNIILEWRNKVVAEEIINSQENNIFATYWALHFDWILQLLQENDSNWKIISEKPFFPFSEQ